MSDTLTGGCRCGQLRYVVTRTLRLNGYACHCTDCQTRTGSACGLQQPVMLADLTVTGERATGTHTQPSGSQVTVTACPHCLTPVMSANSARPGMVIIRAGTLDNSRHYVPAFHIWTASRQPWVTVPAGVPQFEQSPADLAEWQRLLVG